MQNIVHVIGKQVYPGPESSMRLRLPGLSDNRRMKEARLSALSTGQPYRRRRYRWYSYMSEAESTAFGWLL